jgi:hypothetical protein
VKGARDALPSPPVHRVAGRRHSPVAAVDTPLVRLVVVGHTEAEMGLPAAERRRWPAYPDKEVAEEGGSLPVAEPPYLVPDRTVMGPVTANLCQETPTPNPGPPLELPVRPELMSRRPIRLEPKGPVPYLVEWCLRYRLAAPGYPQRSDRPRYLGR